MQPVIEGKHWKGPEFFHLEANQQNKPYKITYNPLTMSSENKKHQVCELGHPHSGTLAVHPVLGRRLDEMTFRGPLQVEIVLCWKLGCLVARGQVKGKSGLTTERMGAANLKTQVV